MTHPSSAQPRRWSYLVSPFARLWRWLTCIPNLQPGPELRRRRLLSTILSMIIVLGSLTVLGELLLHDTLWNIALTLTPIVLLGGALALNRAGRYMAASGLTAAVILNTIAIYLLPTQTGSKLQYLMIALLLGSLILTPRRASVAFAVILLGVVALPLVEPVWYTPQYLDFLYVFCFIGLIAIVTSAANMQDIHQIETQSALLTQEVRERQKIEAELREATSALDRKVAERTAEIQQLNLQLAAELVEREKAGEKMRQSEERYRTLAEAAQESIFIVNRADIVEYVNPFGARWLGHPVDEIIGQPRTAFFPAEAADEQWQKLLEVFETGQSTWGEFETPSIGGSYWLNTGLFPMKNPDGQTYAVLGFSRDISENKRLEEKLQKSEQRYRDIYQNAAEGIFQSSPDGKFLRVNQAMARIFGYASPEEMIALVGHDIEHKIHVKPENRAAYFRLLMENGVVYGFEAENFRKDGSRIWTNTNARLVTDESGEILYSEGLLIDITQRKRAEQDLKASETRFKNLFEHAPISLWEEDFRQALAYLAEIRQAGNSDLAAYFNAHPEAVVHCAGLVKIVDVNAATLTMYGARSKADFFEGLERVYCPESYISFQKELVSLAQGKTWFEDEAVNLTLQGEKMHIALNSIVIPGLNDSSSVFVAITNITKYKDAELEIRRSNEKILRSAAQIRKRNQEITLLSEMDNLLQVCNSGAEAYAIAANCAARLFDSTSGSLAAYLPRQNALAEMTAWGQTGAGERDFHPEDCWAMRRGRIHAVHSAQSGMVCAHLRQAAGSASICVPLTAHGEPLGLLTVVRSGAPLPEPAPFDENTLQLASVFSEHLSLALANINLRETLREKAIRDPLTRLYNRRYMEEILALELKQAERQKSPLGIIMLDIDHFKRFNDDYGHEAGDQVLSELGDFLSAHVRAGDVACRYGGEEFLVILPGSGLADTLKRAEELCAGIKIAETRYRGEKLGVITLSLGVAVYPSTAATAEGLLQAADQAMYRAKAAGRDRVAAPD